MSDVTQKNVVFIDYQNFYHGLYHNFGVRPYNVNMLNLVKECLEQFGIKNPEIRVYTGIPDADTDPEGHGYMKRYTGWLEHNGAKVWTRTLKYRQDEEGRVYRVEKGADVRLGCELVARAITGQLKNAVIISADQDLNESVKVARDTIRSMGLPHVEFHSVKMNATARGIDQTNWLQLSAELVNKHLIERPVDNAKKKQREEFSR